jgi:hypothetical protein
MKMQHEGKIGLSGFDRNSQSSRRAVGHYGNARKAMSGSGVRSARLNEKRIRTSVLVLLSVAVLLTISVFATAPTSKEKRPRSGAPAVVSDIPAPPGFVICGYTYDSVGAELPNCDVEITHEKTGNFTTVNSGSLAFYSVFPPWPDMLVGDLIKVTATSGSLTGENESAIPSGPNMEMNVTLSAAIPEFPILMLPITGTIVLIAVMDLMRRRDPL